MPLLGLGCHQILNDPAPVVDHRVEDLIADAGVVRSYGRIRVGREEIAPFVRMSADQSIVSHIIDALTDKAGVSPCALEGMS